MDPAGRTGHCEGDSLVLFTTGRGVPRGTRGGIRRAVRFSAEPAKGVRLFLGRVSHPAFRGIGKTSNGVYKSEEPGPAKDKSRPAFRGIGKNT